LRGKICLTKSVASPWGIGAIQFVEQETPEALGDARPPYLSGSITALRTLHHVLPYCIEANGLSHNGHRPAVFGSVFALPSVALELFSAT
jgi:hypothetical protein